MFKRFAPGGPVSYCQIWTPLKERGTPGRGGPSFTGGDSEAEGTMPDHVLAATQESTGLKRGSVKDRRTNPENVIVAVAFEDAVA